MNRYYRIARGAALAIAVCVLILTVDYAIARYQAPKDDDRILALQKEVGEEASRAPALAAEHKRITDAKAARKLRIKILAFLLMGAGAAFIASAKLYLAERKKQPVTLDVLKQVKAPSSVALRPCCERHGNAPLTPEQMLAAVDEIAGQFGRTRESAIPILQAIQSQFHYLPDDAMRRITELTDITAADLAGASSFYHQFRNKPAGEHHVRVCHGTACHVAGARQITEELHRALAIPEGEDTSRDRMYTVDEVACIGCCSLAPVMMVDDQTAGKLTPATARAAMECLHPETKA